MNGELCIHCGREETDHRFCDGSFDPEEILPGYAVAVADCNFLSEEEAGEQIEPVEE